MLTHTYTLLLCTKGSVRLLPPHDLMSNTQGHQHFIMKSDWSLAVVLWGLSLRASPVVHSQGQPSPWLFSPSNPMWCLQAASSLSRQLKYSGYFLSVVWWLECLEEKTKTFMMMIPFAPMWISLTCPGMSEPKYFFTISYFENDS